MGTIGRFVRSKYAAQQRGDSPESGQRKSIGSEAKKRNAIVGKKQLPSENPGM